MLNVLQELWRLLSVSQTLSDIHRLQADKQTESVILLRVRK
jgi:hypothetical protein